uniref:Membrane protein n=1 Tax=uncultured bacterium contig00152 TaxID=1181591 RepID=A0A806K2N6_9BACT|nr:membrane protein [uncultured bacterium contig00152]
MKSRFLILVSLAFSLSFADLPQKQLQDSIDAKLESLESRRGLEISGTARSIMLRSAFSSDQDINAYDTSPDVERSGFTQLDLNIGVRPFDAVRGNVILRIGANYQDYFQSIKTVVTVPWLNIEGQVSNWLYWTVGDFRSEISPLAMYSPDVEVLYEPTVYARTRYMARDQVFLEGNKRNLQGANLQTRFDLGKYAGELRVEGIFSRLRRTEVLDFGGYMGNVLPNEADTPGASQASGMDKLLYMGNIELLPLSKNLYIGVTPIIIKDLKSSTTIVKRYTFEDGNCVMDWDNWDYVSPIECELFDMSVNPGVFGPEDTQILTGRLGADIAGIIGNENLIANLTGEYAVSKDKYYYQDGSDTLTADLEGKALLAAVALGWQAKGSWLARMDAKYIMNDSGWYNPLAQSPAFFARRVANSDKDGDILKYGARSPFYSTFDALYHYVPKFMPVDKMLSAGGEIIVGDPREDVYKPTESYAIAPFSKNSYNTGVYTRDELTLLQMLSDPVLQSALPNGLATANRVGPSVNLTAGFGKNNEIEVKGLFTMLEENQVAEGAEKAKFTEMGGGGKVDVGTLVWGLPLELSGSYKNSKTELGPVEFTSGFINAGFYARFYKRFGFAAGFQQIDTESINAAAQANIWHLSDGSQKQWMVGLDYTLAKNAWVAINFGQIIVENTYKTDDPATATGLLPVYIVEHRLIDADYGSKNTLEHSFKQNLVEASINVGF